MTSLIQLVKSKKQFSQFFIKECLHCLQLIHKDFQTYSLQNLCLSKKNMLSAFFEFTLPK